MDNDFLPRILQDKLSIKYEYRFFTFLDIWDFKNLPSMCVSLESYWNSATTKMTEETKKEKDIETQQQGLEYINSLWELIHRILIKKVPGWEPLGMKRELGQKYGDGSKEVFNTTNIHQSRTDVSMCLPVLRGINFFLLEKLGKNSWLAQGNVMKK